MGTNTMAKWQNWSGSVTAYPTTVLRPRGVDELARIVAQAAGVRAVGAGHSFMPLCATSGTLISLAELEGELEISPARDAVWAPAGWSLARLTEALWQHGLSLANQGDVNPQSLAGATATGTHGTGETLGSLSSQVLAVRLVLADGAIVETSPDNEPELFEAARLSLGLLGVAVAIRIRVVPAFHLEERIERRRLDEVLEGWDELAAASRHAEFWVLPYADEVLLKRLHPAEPEGEYRHQNDVNEGAFRAACEISRRLPSVVPRLQGLMMKTTGKPTRRVGPAWRIFPQSRTVRFEEMEYEVPRANGVAALRALIALVRKRRFPMAFPFEFRTVAGDDIWMSPFNAGPAIAISVHQYAPMAWQAMFAEVEAVLREVGGRPHWGKRHTLGPQDVHRLFPRVGDFLGVRARVDPLGKFTNEPLRKLFGIDDRWK